MQLSSALTLSKLGRILRAECRTLADVDLTVDARRSVPLTPEETADVAAYRAELGKRDAIRAAR